MKKGLTFVAVLFIIGLCLYNKPLKFDDKIFFFSVEKGISFKSPFKKQSQIPVRKKDDQDKIVAVSPSNDELIEKPAKKSG